MFEKVQVPILGIVENMAYFICDSCDKKHYLFGNTQTLEKRFGVKTLIEIPIISNLSLQNYMNQGAEALLKVLEEQKDSKQSVPEVLFDEKSISLKFKDGRQIILDNRDVRLACQCAVCVNELTGKKVLNPATVRVDIAPKEIAPLGNYAIGISWNDGHSSGIYPYQMLEQLS
jgi:ATP-binding protein involved in chromosome partitioning